MNLSHWSPGTMDGPGCIRLAHTQYKLFSSVIRKNVRKWNKKVLMSYINYI